MQYSELEALFRVQTHVMRFHTSFLRETERRMQRGVAMQGAEEGCSEQIPRLLLQAHPSTTRESQPSATPDSVQPIDDAITRIGHQPHWSYFRFRSRRWHMRRRHRSAKQNRTKLLICQYSRVRKALVRLSASCPDPPATTVYSSSGSNSVNLEMPRKSSGETFVWNPVKERRLLEKLDDFYSSNPGRQPGMQIYDLWANEFNTEFGGVPAHGSTLYQKKERMRKFYRGWKVLKVQTGLGYDPVADRVVCSDEAWQSFIKVHPECRQLRYEGLRYKELQYNVFEKTHAAGAIGYGSVTMGDDRTPSVDYEFNFANSETHPCDEEDLTPTAGGRQVDTRQGPDVAGPSRRSGSLGKRKQRDATDAMAYEAMEEVRDYFRGISQSGGGSEQSVKNGGLVQCMNIMKGMGYSARYQMMMWHYFDSHQHLMVPFCQVDDDLRREIIGSVINPQPPPAI